MRDTKKLDHNTIQSSTCLKDLKMRYQPIKQGFHLIKNKNITPEKNSSQITTKP